MKNRKILIVIPRMLAGGAEKVVTWLSNSLYEDGYEVTVYSLQNVESFYKLNDGVKYKSGKNIILNTGKYRRRWERLKALPDAYMSILKELRADHYSLVISFNSSADIIIGLINIFGMRIKYICSERNDPNQINPIKFIMLCFIYKRSAAFVCQSKAVKRYYDRYLRNTIVIPNAIDLCVVPHKAESISNRFVAVGRLDEQKNYELLIEAFAEFEKYDKTYTLEIYGDGLKRKTLQHLISSKGLDNKILLKGVSDDILLDIRDAYGFIMTSDFEGFPNVIMEAMAVGLPIITTDFSPGTARELVGNSNGIIVPCKNKKKLVRAMIFLTQNRKLRDEMSKQSSRKIAKYDIQYVYPMWRQLIQSVIR